MLGVNLKKTDQLVNFYPIFIEISSLFNDRKAAKDKLAEFLRHGVVVVQ